jgi:hypothetical protein
VAYGRKPADYDPAAFQGIHARYVLVIIDEADGVPKSIFDAVDALATKHRCSRCRSRQPGRSCLALRHDL